MSVVHAGNVQNQLQLEEHDGTNNAKRVNVVAGGVGQATVTHVGLVTLGDSPSFIGLTTTNLGVGTRFIGLVTNVQAGLTTLAPSPSFIGIVTIANVDIRGAGVDSFPNSDNQMVVAGMNYGFNGTDWDRIRGDLTNGLDVDITRMPSGATVTALSVNTGTTKALKTIPIVISVGSAATIAITNTFKITSLLLNSNSTVRLNVRSGATHLTGNASLGINLFPGGGWAEAGSVDSPLYLGLAAAAPIVIEKADSGGLIAQIGGKVTYFEE
jgi:hypothetical protein